MSVEKFQERVSIDWLQRGDLGGQARSREDTVRHLVPWTLSVLSHFKDCAFTTTFKSIDFGVRPTPAPVCPHPQAVALGG